jgi:hypothetical protein
MSSGSRGLWLLLLLACGLFAGCGDDASSTPGSSSAAAAAAAAGNGDVAIPDLNLASGNEAHSGDPLADEFFRVIRDLVELKRGADDRLAFEKALAEVARREGLGDEARRRTAIGASVAEILQQAERFRPRDGRAGKVTGQQKIFIVSKAQTFADRLRDALDPERDAALDGGWHLEHTMKALSAPELSGVEIPEGYQPVSWRLIGGFTYEEGQELPAEVKALAGKKVAMSGFVMSLGAFEDMHEFSLVESAWACCFGLPPDVNQTVLVTIPDDQPGLDLLTTPVLVTGTFKIEFEVDDGYLVNMYAFTLDDVVEID